jgi:hypothetical protein
MKFLGTGKLETAPRKFESGLKTVLGLKLGTELGTGPRKFEGQALGNLRKVFSA